jgi:hypothetical protein
MRLRWWVLISILLASFSFSVLYYVYTNLKPYPNVILAGPQLLFFGFMFLGLGASTVPVTAYMNYRFAKPGWGERDKGRLLREGIWVGLFGVLLAYLQLVRSLNWTIGLVLACVFILIETFFLTRE